MLYNRDKHTINCSGGRWILMDINMYHHSELNQKLSITPQLQQSIKILQMGCQELIKHIEQEALENPMIEIEPMDEELDHYEKLKRKLDWLSASDEENRVYYQTSCDTDDCSYTAISENENTLEHYLLSQLDLLSLSPVDYKIAYYIIQSLDENGYLKTTLGDISKMLRSNKNKVESILKIIHSLEPPGIAARNLKECLTLQLIYKGVTDKNAFSLVDRYLEMLGKNKLDFIAKELNISMDEVKRITSMVKSLNPRPGNICSTIRSTRYVTPDVVVVKFKDYYEVLINDFSYPKIKISSYYKNTLLHTTDKNAKDYIINKMKQASWIMKCLEQRNTTLSRVAKAIVDIQKKFFDMGPGYLVPMILKDIAEKLEVHESTVSRAVNDKYLQCSWGIYEMKYFFSTGLCTKAQDDTTSENIKLLIKQLVDDENKMKPYSDQKLTNILKERGVQISRRTVAKYRGDLKIPNASRRKEF